MAGDDPVDLIVGKSRWQVGILDRAREAAVEGTRVPVAGPADLIALKLYAGGPQDAWDIEQLLGAADGAALAAAVERMLPDLPDETRALWARTFEEAAERRRQRVCRLLGDALRDTPDPRLRGS